MQAVENVGNIFSSKFELPQAGTEGARDIMKCISPRKGNSPESCVTYSHCFWKMKPELYRGFPVFFSARGFNIESLTVAPTEDPTVSRMTLVTSGSDQIIEQITKHLNKLVDVIKVIDLKENAHIERELLLIKIVTKDGSREEIKRLNDIFRGRIIDVTDKSYTIEMTGDGEKLDAFIFSLDQRSILEVVRSGVSGIARGDKAILQTK